MDEQGIFEACFSLAEDLMWEKNTAPLDKIAAQIDELSRTTNKYVSIVKKNFFMVEDLPDREEVMISAIRHLNALAIPPLKGNYQWFEYSLVTLLEIVNPYSAAGKSALPFLLAARTGLDQMIEWSNHSEDE
jgi:hypothetical protein